MINTAVAYISFFLIQPHFGHFLCHPLLKFPHHLLCCNSLIHCLISPVPCAPANPQTNHECSSNVIVFSWQPTNNTFYYVATAVDDTGKVTECRTPENMCYFTNTGCGQFYMYSVYAVSSECNSEVTQPEFVRTCK